MTDDDLLLIDQCREWLGKIPANVLLRLEPEERVVYEAYNEEIIKWDSSGSQLRSSAR